MVGAEATKREAIDTLKLFLHHQTFADELGGTPRRGVLFEGLPGTGKTYLATAMAAEATAEFVADLTPGAARCASSGCSTRP